jgi:hypothetical protein
MGVADEKMVGSYVTFQAIATLKAGCGRVTAARQRFPEDQIRLATAESDRFSSMQAISPGEPQCDLSHRILPNLK